MGAILKSTVLVLFVVVLAACDGDPVRPALGPIVLPEGDPDDPRRIDAVYTNDNDADGVRTLFAVARDARVINLSRPVGDDVHVSGFGVSPDNLYTWFIGDDVLHISPVNDIVPFRLSQAGETKIRSCTWSPNSWSLAYSAEVNGRFGLFAVDLDGANRAEIGGPAGNVSGKVAWLNDWIVFTSDKAVAGQQELYSARPDGTEEHRLSFTAAPPAEARSPLWTPSPDGTLLALRFDIDDEDDFQLYVVPVNGSAAATRVSNAAEGVGDVGASGWVWLPDGTGLLYPQDEQGTGHRAVFYGAADGSESRKVSAPLSADAGAIKISLDGTSFAYREGINAVHAGTVAGGAAEIATHALVGNLEFALSGGLLAYDGRDGSPGADPKLFLLRVDGVGGPIDITGIDEIVENFAWIPPLPPATTDRIASAVQGPGGRDIVTQEVTSTDPPAAEEQTRTPFDPETKTNAIETAPASIVANVEINRLHFRVHIPLDGPNPLATVIGLDAQMQLLVPDIVRPLLHADVWSLSVYGQRHYEGLGQFVGVNFARRAYLFFDGVNVTTVEIHPTIGPQISISVQTRPLTMLEDFGGIYVFADETVADAFFFDNFLLVEDLPELLHGIYTPDPDVPADHFTFGQGLLQFTPGVNIAQQVENVPVR